MAPPRAASPSPSRALRFLTLVGRMPIPRSAIRRSPSLAASSFPVIFAGFVDGIIFKFRHRWSLFRHHFPGFWGRYILKELEHFFGGTAVFNRIGFRESIPDLTCPTRD